MTGSSSPLPCEIKFHQPCTDVAEYTREGRFFYKTFDQCHSLCCADSRCKSFDSRSTTGYNCALSYSLRDREDLEEAEADTPCGDERWSYSEIH